ncbi:MAG: SdpI family protein [Gemmatimonadota bacterium]
MSKPRNLGVVVAGYVASAVVYFQLLGQQAIDRLGDAPIGLLFLGLPTFAGAVSMLLGNLLERDQTIPGDELSVETCQRIVSRLVVFMIVLHGFVLTALLGPASWMYRLVFLAVGGTLIGIGNLLPRTRPNSVIGIRIQRAVTNRLTWIRLHRVTGRVTVGAGIGIVAAAFLPRIAADALFSLVPLAAFGVLGAYMLKLGSKRPSH